MFTLPKVSVVVLCAGERGRKLAARRDVALTLVMSVMATVVSVRFDLSERLMVWAHAHERFQVDEMPTVLLVLAACLIWFSTRRYIEARRQLLLRTVIELRLAESLAQNQRLAQQYLDMQEHERKALARDLHDELGQYLNVIKLDAIAICDAPEQGSGAIDVLARGMIENVNRMYAVVAGLIRQLRPVGFDELGVAAALEHCVNEWRTRLGASIHLSIETSLQGFDELRALAFFRLVQEALTNVARHAQAKTIEIEIWQSLDSSEREIITVRITDDGVGANLEAPGSGLGLVGMRERVAMFGGTFKLSSVPGNGFTIEASMPVAARSDAAWSL